MLKNYALLSLRYAVGGGGGGVGEGVKCSVLNMNAIE